jgi:hypothetical protein
LGKAVKQVKRGSSRRPASLAGIGEQGSPNARDAIGLVGKPARQGRRCDFGMELHSEVSPDRERWGPKSFRASS